MNRYVYFTPPDLLSSALKDIIYVQHNQVSTIHTDTAKEEAKVI